MREKLIKKIVRYGNGGVFIELNHFVKTNEDVKELEQSGFL